jgi:hypothetical protein
MNKIYKKNNYIIITGPDIISEFPITNIYVDKKELTNEYYIYFNSVTSKCVAIVNVPNILKENDTPYTQEEWETFYTVNTGFFFNVGGDGGGDTGAIPADQFVETYSDLPDPTTVIYQIWIVKNSEGTSWLPGSLGGTYYPEGGYASDGTKWVYHKDSYQASQLEVDAGTVTNKWITPFTFENASKWLDKYDISNPSGYQTASQVQTIADAKVVQIITNGVTETAPSQDAVFDALALKAPLASPTFTGTVRIPSIGVPSILSIGTSGDISPLSPTSYASPDEIAHVKGVTSAIQTQLINKQPLTTVLTNTTASFTTADETKLDKYPSTATNGKILQGNGTNYVEVDAPSGSGVAPQTGQIIVTSGVSFTTPANITVNTVLNIELVGAGGGGAGALNTTSGAKSSAGGGGGYCFKRITGLSPSTTYTCAIGAAGVGSALGVNGNAGTATTLTILGVTYTANGGGGGLTGGTLAGGVGGTAINGDLNYSGQNGGDSLTAGPSAPSAKGGDTAKGWGLGGASVRNAIAGSNATGNGGGGSGGHASAGGNGSGGIIFCQWFNQ